MKDNLCKRHFFSNNSGISLIELIVIMAIIVVVTISAFAGFGMLRSGNVAQATDGIKGQLMILRQNTLSVQGIWSLEIVNDDGTYYTVMYNNNNEIKKEKLSSRICISYGEKGKALSEIGENKKLVIFMKPSSGEIKNIRIVDSSTDALKFSQASETDGTACMYPSGKSFIFSIGKDNTNPQNEILLVYATGRVIE